jgi:hypothetical protein
MAGPNPPGFDPGTVLAELRTAMQFGAPSNAADRATFFMPRVYSTTEPVDDLGVPFNPEVRPNAGTPVKHTVPCAIDYDDAQGKVENFGIIVASKVIITLLGPDYETVKGFEYVVIAGQKYLYRKTEPPVALGTLDVWTVHCQAEDEG